jgi:hypothetical protein
MTRNIGKTFAVFTMLFLVGIAPATGDGYGVDLPVAPAKSRGYSVDLPVAPAKSRGYDVGLPIAPAKSAGHGIDMTIGARDVEMQTEYEPKSGKITGIHLYVRQKPGVSSVLLTEELGFYALRAPAWNEYNGNEIRYLNGRLLETQYAKYSIIDSTPELYQFHNDGFQARAFHLFLPAAMVYGYPDIRYGVLHLEAGARLSIRTYNALYADNTRGGFRDNLFQFEDPAQQRGERPVPRTKCDYLW